MPDTTLTNNQMIVSNIYTEFENGALDAVLASLAPDVHWTEPETFFLSGTFNTPQEVSTHVFGRVPELFEEFSVQPEEYVATGDTVCVLGRFVGTTKGTAKPFDLRFCHVWNLRDGKVVRFENIVDTGTIQNLL